MISGVNSIQLLNIFDFPPDRRKEQNRVGRIKTNVLRQLEALSEEKYFAWNHKSESFASNEPKDIEMSDKFYDDILLLVNDIGITTKVILENDIEFELTKLTQNEGDFIFDVTGLLTRYMVKATMFLHDNNSFTIHAFEITRNRKGSHEDLLHNLKHSEMRYPELNLNNYIVYKSDFKEIMASASGHDILKNRVEELEDKVAKGKIEEVIETIRKHADGDYKNDAILISARLIELQREKTRGEIKHEDAETRMNNIRNSLLNLLNKLKE